MLRLDLLWGPVCFMDHTWGFVLKRSILDACEQLPLRKRHQTMFMVVGLTDSPLAADISQGAPMVNPGRVQN